VTAPTSWSIHEGAAFLAPSGPGNHQHLFVILNDPKPLPLYGSQDCVCVVNFSTPTTHIPYDTTCIFNANSHRFLRHDSYVFYARAAVKFVRDIETNIANGLYAGYLPDFTAAQVQTIKNGLQASPKTPRDIKALQL